MKNEKRKQELLVILAILFFFIFSLVPGCLMEENKKNGESEKPSLQIMAHPTQGITPLNIFFYANITNAKSTIDSYIWDFDDGTITTNEKPSHLFSLPGDYSVKLTVAFNDSTLVTDTCIISVYDKSQFYGLWHYTQGKGDYESIIFYPNKIVNITIKETGLTYVGSYEVFNETLQISIDQIHQYGRYFYKINDSNKLTLINKKNRDNAVYIKQRKDPHTLYVGGAGRDNYSTIQEGIENAWYGDNIYVYEGIYHENIMITKSLNLMGTTGKKTFIDGRGKGHVIEIHANMVNISNFTIMNSSSSSSFSGIKIISSSHITIDACNITDNFYGLWLYESTRNTIKNCTIAHNKFDGIMMNEITSENEITQCVITHNDRNGITLCCGSNYNSITHCTISENNDTGVSIQALGNVIVLNNFIKNHLNAYGYGTNFWDNGNQGNYWSDFDELGEGAYDHNKDNVIDTPYTKIGVNNKDRYPLSHLQT